MSAPLVFGALLVLLVGGSLAVFGAPHSAGPASTGSGAPRAPLAVPATTLHGDLVVTAANSPYLISPATSSSSTYVQEGNITVQSGGTLVVSGETVEFLQFIASTGTLSQRASHIFTFHDQGKVTFQGSSLITDSSILNAYTKLAINVSGGGSLTLLGSVFEFPGWLSVSGPGSTLTVNESTIRGTAGPPALVENRSIIGDTEWAPSLSVTGGAQAILGGSTYLGTDKDNSTAMGTPGPLPLTAGPVSLTATNGFTVRGFAYPTDSENVSRALLYPSFLGGTLTLVYTASAPVTSTGSNLEVLGVNYTLGVIHFAAGPGTASIPIPPAALAAINAAGPTGWLESTGAFDQPASTGWTIATTNSALPVNVSSQALSLTPAASYNLTVSGPGSSLVAADSVLDLNWNLTPGAAHPANSLTPTPWGSNKLALSNGAAASLANLTIVQAPTALFWNDSAVEPDASSTAVMYRWAEIPVRAPGNTPVLDAQLSAFYSYDASQSNNATATALNSLASASPALAAYATWWDSTHGISAYGQTGPNGNAYLLLADTVLQGATLPDGVFLGGYHVAVRLAGLTGAAGVQWGYAALTAYPSGMTPATPDAAQPVVYANYLPSVAVTSVDLLSGGVSAPNQTYDIGSWLTVQATLKSAGTAPVTTIASSLYYASNKSALANGPTVTNLLPGATSMVNFTWKVNQTTVGLHGHFVGNFSVLIVWNGGNPPTGGSVVQPFRVSLGPSRIAFAFSPPSGTLNSGTEYFGSGSLAFNGTGNAILNVTVISPSGTRYLLGTALQAAGPVEVALVPVANMEPGTYHVEATAYYNGVTAYSNTTNAFSIPGSTGSSSSFLDQKLGPFSVLEWIIIAVAGIAAVLVGLFMLRHLARGKLVECGECGNPLPESATVCPKCGAEFETEIVRCSRCGSTIPASSEVCPECAAQLLGSADAEKSDPERQGYNDLVERYRMEAKRELADNYNEGAFWDWWKRQASYVSFSQWRLTQGQGGPRAGMGAPPSAGIVSPDATPPGAAPAPVRRTAPPAAAAPRAAPAPAAPRAPSTPAVAPAPVAAPAAPAATAGGMKPCSNCGKEIPPDYLVCPFCGAVTQ